LDRSDFSFESNLNARFLSSHSLKACTFSISNSLKSFTCKVFVFIQQALSKYCTCLKNVPERNSSTSISNTTYLSLSQVIGYFLLGSPLIEQNN
ncbi:MULTISPECIES: hypothetical protein, partial [Cyanophyceae]